LGAVAGDELLQKARTLYQKESVHGQHPPAP
jgi:hypothetical protein